MCLSVVEINHFSCKGDMILYCYHEWFSYISIILLVLLCSAFTGFCDDFSMVSVPLGFEIYGMDQSKNWVSENGVFAFGFLKKYDDDLDGCEVGIRYNLGNATANLPVCTVGGRVRVSMNSTIRLDMDGRLVLVQNENGNTVWSSNTSNLGISRASLLDKYLRDKYLNSELDGRAKMRNDRGWMVERRSKNADKQRSKNGS